MKSPLPHLKYEVLEFIGDMPFGDHYQFFANLDRAKEAARETFASRANKPNGYNVAVVNDEGHTFLVVRNRRQS